MTKIKIICTHCKKLFERELRFVNLNKKRKRKNFCSYECSNNYLTKYHQVTCKHCAKSFIKLHSQYIKFPNHFCSQSCAATYNNAHKTKGTRVSKLELWLAKELPLLYPTLEFHFNCKDAINSELDIYIPSLKLAFELNGIFHYEPIFSKKKLKQIKNNDDRKFQACIEAGIELCIIDVSKQKYFKEKTSVPYLQIISAIINKKY